jgi:hypothetical protein
MGGNHMKHAKIALSASMIAILSGCASIIEGSSQQIAVNTNPPAAQCDFIREGAQLAQIPQAPGSVTVKKTREDIAIQCQRPGYETASYVNKSGLEPWFFGNVLIGGLIGMGVDWATGAYNEYDEQVNLTLHPSAAADYGNAAPAPVAAPMDDLPTLDQLDNRPKLVPAPSAVAPVNAPAPVAAYTTDSAPRLQQDYPQPQLAPVVEDSDRYVAPPLAPIAIPAGDGSYTGGWGRR